MSRTLCCLFLPIWGRRAAYEELPDATGTLKDREKHHTSPIPFAPAHTTLSGTYPPPPTARPNIINPI